MYSKILVPVDGSAPSTAGLEEACRLAKNSGAAVRAINVVNELVMVDTGYVPPLYYQQIVESLRQGGRKVLEDAKATARENGVELQTELVETVGGHASDQIIDQAQKWGADLIVMGTHGRRGLRRFALGSDAEMVLRTTPVPVLLIRGKTATA